jgi:hypothetical protein
MTGRLTKRASQLQPDRDRRKITKATSDSDELQYNTSGSGVSLGHGARFALKRLIGSERSRERIKIGGSKTSSSGSVGDSSSSSSTSSLLATHQSTTTSNHSNSRRRSTVVDKISIELLQSIAAQMSEPEPVGVRLRTHKQLFWQYPSSFVGSEAVTWLCENVPLLTVGFTDQQPEIVRHRAVALGQRLMSELAAFEHVSGDKHQLLQDKRLYYVFKSSDTVPVLTLKPAKDYTALAQVCQTTITTPLTD